MYFKPLDYLEPSSAFFAILAGCLAIIIPLLALFFVMLRVVFKTKPMNNYASMALLSTWIVSIVMILYFVLVTNQDLRQETTISVEKTIDTKDTYVLSLNDVRVIKTTDEEFNDKKIDHLKQADLIGNYLRDEIRISVEPLDSLKTPYLQYNYIASGGNYAEASARAKKISYQVKQNENTILFNNHFALQEKQVIRDQHVRMNLYLPVGTKVLVEQPIEWMIDGIDGNDCRLGKDLKYSEFIMTKDGLKCIRILEEEKVKAEEERLEQLKEQEKEQDKEAKKQEKKENKKKKEQEEATSEESNSSSEEDNA